MKDGRVMLGLEAAEGAGGSVLTFCVGCDVALVWRWWYCYPKDAATRSKLRHDGVQSKDWASYRICLCRVGFSGAGVR